MTGFSPITIIEFECVQIVSQIQPYGLASVSS
jgi:hypothetical protein